MSLVLESDGFRVTLEMTIVWCLESKHYKCTHFLSEIQANLNYIVKMP